MGARIVRLEDQDLAVIHSRGPIDTGRGKGTLASASLTPPWDSAVITGFSACARGLIRRAHQEISCFRGSATIAQTAAPHKYETHLPSFENSPRTCPWVSRSHEDSRWSRRHQRSTRQRTQASFGLSARPNSAVTPDCATVTCQRVGRMRVSADFERVLAQPAVVANRHFALHGLASEPCIRVNHQAEPTQPDLLTVQCPGDSAAVDNSSAPGHPGAPPRCVWLGIVVPKRYARRAVTRSMLKRQIRSGVERFADGLPLGMWVFRLRSSYDPQRFVAAAPGEMRLTVRSEVTQLLQALKSPKLGPRSNPLPP